jgi:glycogen debranching enzyme
MNCDSGELIPVESWTCAYPALLGICNAYRRKIVMESLINPQKFFRPAGISSVSAEDPLYHQARRSIHGRMMVPNCWGPMWVLPNVLVFRALQEQGYRAHASELASRVVATIRNDFFESGTIHDSYDADTRAPLTESSTVAWKTMALELVDYVRHNIWPQAVFH